MRTFANACGAQGWKSHVDQKVRGGLRASLETSELEYAKVRIQESSREEARRILRRASQAPRAERVATQRKTMGAMPVFGVAK